MRSINKLLAFTIFASLLNAQTTYVSTMTGDRVVTGYFNETNSVSIIVTLGGTDVDGGASDKSNQYIELYVGFNSTATVSTIATQMSGLGSNPVAAAKAGADNTHTFTVSSAALIEAYGASPEGKYFDFKVNFSGDVNTYFAVTPSDGGTAHKFDNDDPGLNNLSYPNGNNIRFKDQKVTYQPDEDLFQTPATYQSYVRFLGDNSGSGADNGNSHIYNFSGGDLNTGSNITKNPISFSSGNDLIDGAGYDVAFFLYDVAGNYYAATWRSNVIYDKTAPRISSATTASSDGTYKKDDQISVTLNFSEGVYTSGVMDVTFTMDGDDATVQIASFASSGSPVTSKTFTYTVLNGNVTSDLTIGSVSMSSGSLFDAADNAMSNFAFTGNNLGDNADLNIDGELPTITSITSDKADGTYGVGTNITVTTTFSEAVTLAGGDFVMTMETGDTDRDVTISSISASTTTSGTYTVQSGDASADLNATTNASTTGTITDAAGNAMSNFAYGSNFASKSIVIETTPPTITNVTSTTNNGTYGVGDDINVTVTFSEDVTLSGSGAVFTVPLETGSTNSDYDLEISSISSAGTGSGTYTVRANDDTGGSDLTVKTTPGLSTTGTVADDAGNNMADFSIPSGQNLADLKNIIIDAVYPTITNVNSTTADGTYKINDNVNVTINFSEDVTLSGGTLDITLNHGNTGNAKVSISAFGPASTASGTYTVAATDTTNDLNHTSIALGTGASLVDGGNNSIQSWSPATELATNKALVIDGNRPTIMKIRSSKAAGYYKIGDVIPVQIYFTEAVTTSAANIVTATLETGSTNPDAIVTYGAISNATTASADYTVRAGDYNSSLTLNSIAISGGQSVDDQAGNSMTDPSIPSGKNLADEIVDIFVDGVVPVDPGTAISMVSTGGNVVADKYNDTNTGVDFTVAIQSSDASLVGGTIQIKAKIAPNGWVSIGDAHTITDANKTAGSATISVLSAPIEALTGFATDAEIKIKATVTDVAGNATDWAESTNSLTVDVTRPTITSATSTSDAGLYNTADAINTTLGFSEAVTLSGGDLTITLNTTGTSTVAEADLSNSSSASATYTVASGESTADKTPAMLTVSNVNVTAGELKDAAGNPMVFPVTSIASNIADIKTIEVDGIDPTKMAIQSVKTVTDTIRAGYWNGDNTAVKVRVGLDKNDASLAGGTIQVTAQISGSFENIGTAATIVQDSVAIEYQTIEIANSITGGTKGIEEISNFQDLSTINFKAVVTDKAGNATSYDAASTTLIVDQTYPTAFTTDSVITVTDEIVYGYWNEDNTAINVQVPIENDATLENGTVQVQAEADGTFEFIGAGSLNSTPTAITSSDLGTEKIITITGPSTLATIKELEELSGFGDSDVITFRAIIVDVAGNSTVGGLSPTEMTVDQTDPGAPTIALKTDSDTGIGNWDKLTNDDTPTFTITNVNNTDSVFIKVATDAATLALNSSIVTRDKSASSSIDLTSTSQANGTHLVTAALKDIAGNWSTDATNTFVRIDTIPPDVPNAPDLLEDDDTGFNNKDNITKTTQPHFIFTGLSSTIDSLRLVIDAGASVGRDSIMSQVTTDTFKVSTALASGYHTAGVIAIDSAGNTQNISSLLPFVVDNVAPPIPTAPDMTAATDLGMSSTDNETKAQKPNFDVTNIELGSFINLYHADATPDTTLAKSDTVGTGVTTITLAPTINMDDGTYILYATAEDTAGNISESSDLTGVVIDATAPTITTHYYNSTIHTAYGLFANKSNTDSVRFGKGGDNLELIAKLSEPAGTTPEPTLDVTYGSSATPTIDDMAKTSKANNDSTWIWKFDLPTGTANNGTAKVVFTAYDIAGNLATSFTDTQSFVVDNTAPAAFTTGLATAHGDTNVSMVVESKTGWFINSATDSLKILVNIDPTDNSLVGGGYVDIQANIRNKMANNWASIKSKITTNPFADQDSTEGLGNNKTFLRKKTDLVGTLEGSGLVQGDTIDLRAVIYDRALNFTAGTQSESFFVLDTLPPTIGTFITDTLFTAYDNSNLLSVNRYLSWTSDTVGFGIKNWLDPVSTNEKASGIDRFEFALYQGADSTAATTFTKFRDFKGHPNKTDSVVVDTFALTHLRRYRTHVRAVDVAGNTSDPNNVNAISNSFVRHNARPVVDTVAALIASEDVLLEQLLTVNDKDLLTLRSDEFTYDLTTMKLDTTQTPIDSAVVTNLTADVSTSGKVSFTPTKLDTAKYVFRIIVTDAWTLKDTVDLNIRALPVNDPPVLDLSSIAKLSFLEGANSDSINLTRYVYDEDNDTSSIKFSFRIASIIPANIGYPTAKMGFLSDFSHDFKKSYISKLVDEFPSSTIIQKNNSFVVYPASVTEFRDPIKVDSLSQSDSLYTWITQTDTASADTNYYTNNDMIVEFTATDPDGLEGKDTVTFFINPINDPPVWAGLRDTVVKENDSLYLDFANYLTDVDDSTLTLTILPLTYDANVSVVPSKTFEKKATGYEYTSKARNDTVEFKPDALWFKKDSGPWDPTDTTSNQIKFKITAADDDTSAIDTFVVKVQRVPRPEIRMYVVQNNAFTNYYEIFLVDSVGKTKDLTLKVQSKAVTLDTAAAFTYVGHYSFQAKGNYAFEVIASGVVGDTSITETVGLTLAKMYGKWSGNSADGQFQVIGQNGSVDFDQSIMILDSTLFEPYFNDRASYLLGNDAYRFKKSVEISMPGDDEEMAIYRRSTGSGWIELPSITMGNRVNAYTEKMGYFRMGPKTLIVPGQTSLHQNYPNPFNPVTTIEYDLGFVDGPFQRVTVTVYDILGRNVKTLVSEEQSIGRYRVRWNGKDGNGVPVSSGVYFVHLLTDMGRSQTKKIMLMR
jgi:hypothetical protein